MALQGNLKELRLGDVLQAVLSAGNRGVLRVRSTGRRAVLHVSPTGLRVIVPEVIDDRMIVDAFVARGVVSPEIVERAKGSAGGASPLDVLVGGGSIPAEDLRAVLVEAAEEAVLDVLSWTEGDFRFEEGAEPEPANGPAAGVDVEPFGVLLKSAQRADERRRLAERFGGEVRLLLRVPGQEPREEIEEHVLRILRRLDGSVLLDDVALQEGVPLFEAQRSALVLVDAGLARPPEASEIAQFAKTREAAGDVRGAFALLRQWQGMRPNEPEGFAAAVELAARTNRFEDEADALRALGRVWLKISRPREAKEVYDRLLLKRPGDRDALTGLRQASRALHDEDGYSDTTRRLAQHAIEDGEAQQAAAMLQELLDVQPADLDAHVLRAKALARLADRSQAVAELERIADLLPNPCRRKADRAAASWCRETLAHLAPDRSDLLRRFRTMTEAPEAARRRALILGGFLLACSGLGFVFWPRPAVSLLDRARAAADRQDDVAALALVAEIVDRWPDSTEAGEALALKARIDTAGREAGKRVEPKILAEVHAKLDATLAGLPRWPDPRAVKEAEDLTTLLRTPEGAQVVPEATTSLRGPLAEAVSSIRRAAMSRCDALDLTESAITRPPANLEKFRAIVDQARSALDKDWVNLAARAALAARKLAASLDEKGLPGPLMVDVRSVESDVAATERAIAARPRSVERLAREYHRALIEDAYERARIDAGPLLVAGELNRAEDYYVRLTNLLAQVDSDPELQPLRPVLDGRRIGEFARAKMEMMATIHRGLEAAAAAEKAGNLAGAAAAYASLVRRFELISFDRVFTIPLRVESVPTGARVEMNSKLLAERAPAIVRYGWGAQAVVTLSLEGFETQSVALRTADTDPEPVLRVAMIPTTRWTKPVTGVVEAPPLDVDGDVVLSNRGGVVERRARETGEALWSTDTRCVEGVRGRPAYEAGLVWVPLLDGRVARISAETGNPVGDRKLPGRPVGDVVALSGRVAVATDGGVAVFPQGSDDARVVPVPGIASTGLVAAHGAFWVGDTKGAVLRVDAVSFAVTSIATGGTDALVSLGAGERGVYAVSADGALTAIDASLRAVRWRRPGLGEVVGTPAEAQDVVAVADRGGRVHLLGVADGAARGIKEAGSEARGGLVAHGSRLLTSLSDGRVWAYDVATGTLVLDAPFHGTSRFPLAILTGGIVATPAQGASVALFQLPR